MAGMWSEGCSVYSWHLQLIGQSLSFDQGYISATVGHPSMTGKIDKTNISSSATTTVTLIQQRVLFPRFPR